MRHTNPILHPLDAGHQTPGEITCPRCGEPISLSEALRTEIADRFEREYQKKAQVAAALIKQKEELIAKKAQLLDREYLEKMAVERANLEKKLRQQLEQSKNVEVEDLKNQITEQKKRLEDAVQAELELRKKARSLEEKEKQLELEVIKKLQAEKIKVEEEVGKRVAEEQRLKMAEKDKQLDDMRRKIEELKRKSELTSQQLQGEVLELELEAILKKYCLVDIIEPVAKGARGGDVVQKVMTTSAQHVGTIVWETKRTKAWSEGWIDKIKEDQRAITAECAVIVSDILPKGITGLGFYDGVWVCDMKTAPGLATALRLNLLQLHSARASVAGRETKMEIIYQYLTGTQFAQRIQAIVETFRDMQESLSTEKKVYQKIWAQREAQLEKAVLNTASVYGSLQGIAGGTLPKIEALEVSSLSIARVT